MTQGKGTLLGATLLVAGTAIGGGMLALPVATGEAGFFPSLLLMVLGWAFMTTTALLLAEVNLSMEPGVHVITMASRFLGRPGRIIAWIFFLFISYASLVAYTAGGGEFLRAASEVLFHVKLTAVQSILIFTAIFGCIVYCGNLVVARVNTVLVIGLVLSYVLLVTLSASYVDGRNLMRVEWHGLTRAVPLMLTIFSFQTIVPSLTIYLKRDGKKLRKSIIFGTTISLLIYIIWQWLVLGTVLVDGEYGLAEALAQGKGATEFLRIAVGNNWIGALADSFAFFALVTSFLGIALGLIDFWADGLKMKRGGISEVKLGLLVAIPVLFIVFTMERAFLIALDCSGGIGDAVLNGIFPALLLWVARYKRHIISDYHFPGGKPLLLAVMAYGAFVLTIEILGKYGIVVGI